MSTLAHAFEAAGMATVTLGSIRAQLEGTAAPRGLYCNFPLGRPLGRPNDAEFQHHVLWQALSMVDRVSEQTIEDFPDTIIDDGETALACPLPPRHDPDAHPAVDEALGIRGAYDRAVSDWGNAVGTGRTVDADQIPEAVGAFARCAEGTHWKKAGIPGIPARVAQDIRGYYEMAAIALADHTPEAYEATRWFFHKTLAGKAILDSREAIKNAGETRDKWHFLAPFDL